MTTSCLRLLTLCGIFLWPAVSLAQTPPAQTVRGAARQLLGPAFSAEQIEAVASVLELQIATFPIGSSSGGFTLTFPKSGGVNFKADGFGPLFAERASTLGNGLAIGISSQSTRFVSYEGEGLRNGDLRIRTPLNGAFLDLDRFTFDLQTQTTSLTATYAADTHVDVGIVVPFIRTTLSGYSSSLVPGASARDERIVDVTGYGIGDIVLRGKWNFFGGLAALGDLSVPTGSEERLAGTGRFRLKTQIVASSQFGAFAPHANVGYTFGGRGVRVQDDGVFLPRIERASAGDELNYTLGADVVATRDVTVFGDLIGRSFRSVVRFDEGQRLLSVPNIGVIPVESFVARAGTLDTRLGVVGAKARLFGNGLVSAALLFPLNEGGLKPGLTPVVGLEYRFGGR